MMRNMLLAMDPPRHVELPASRCRRSFKAKVIGGLEDRIRDDLPAIMADAREQGEVEFVHDVTAELPSQVIGELMGLPEEDWALHPRAGRAQHERPGPRDRRRRRRPRRRTRRSTWRCTRSSSPGSRRAEPARGRPHVADPRRRLRRRADERHRLRQLLRAARHRRQRHDQDDAGVGAARAARAPRPARRAARRPVAASPARSRRSCAGPTRSTTSGAPPPPTPSCAARKIAAGDKVAMYYTSANRDEDVFDDPQRFDIHRHPNPHLSFGIGEHFCLGVAPGPARGPGVLRGAARHVPHHRAHRRARPRPLQPQQRLERAAGSPGRVACTANLRQQTRT